MVAGVRAIDLAPTLAYLMGIPGPQNAAGRSSRPPPQGQLKEITILDISDYHGQLVPLRGGGHARRRRRGQPDIRIGGSAFLKPWFDAYRAEAPGGSITVAAGDSIGATPPISSFFDDKPTIELMNLMGFSADGLGNHNFDKSATFFRNEIVPLANFPYLSSNIVDAAGNTPRRVEAVEVFDAFDGAKLGLVGFSNEDIPELTRPGALDPFHVEPRIPRVQAEVNRLSTQWNRPIVVMGHDGDGRDARQSDGPIVDLADALNERVIGDHTNFQVVSTRPNGVLVVENLSKGVRFTRVRLLVDTKTKEVVYKTADFHKPWNIGVTPNPAIQARIDALNEELKPILGTVIGASTVEVLRSDSCGRVDGRLCESRSETSSRTPCGRPSRPTSPSLTQVGSGPSSRARRRGAATGSARASPRRRGRSRADRCWRCSRSGTPSSPSTSTAPS